MFTICTRPFVTIGLLDGTFFVKSLQLTGKGLWRFLRSTCHTIHSRLNRSAWPRGGRSAPSSNPKRLAALTAMTRKTSCACRTTSLRLSSTWWTTLRTLRLNGLSNLLRAWSLDLPNMIMPTNQGISALSPCSPCGTGRGLDWEPRRSSTRWVIGFLLKHLASFLTGRPPKSGWYYKHRLRPCWQWEPPLVGCPLICSAPSTALVANRSSWLPRNLAYLVNCWILGNDFSAPSRDALRSGALWVSPWHLHRGSLRAALSPLLPCFASTGATTFIWRPLHLASRPTPLWTTWLWSPWIQPWLLGLFSLWDASVNSLDLAQMTRKRLGYHTNGSQGDLSIGFCLPSWCQWTGRNHDLWCGSSKQRTSKARSWTIHQVGKAEEIHGAIASEAHHPSQGLLAESIV